MHNHSCHTGLLTFARLFWPRAGTGNHYRLKVQMQFRPPLAMAIFCCAALLLIGSGPCSALQPVRIGTGGQTGVYYPIGTLIAEGLTQKNDQADSPLHGLISVALNSAGSIENTKKIVAGELEAALVQADVASFAHQGLAPFSPADGALPIRAIASLYPEKFQLVVRNDAGVNRFQDLTGKRISIDEEGSGSLAVMRIVLAAHGMTENDLQPVYLKPVFFEEKMRNGQLQGFSLMAGAPMEAVQLLQETGVTLVPLDDAIISDITKQYPYLFPGTIEAGTYADISRISTIEVSALLVVHEGLADDLAYAITEALFSDSTTTLLRDGHPQGRSITLETALNGLSIPLHPGAERFYRRNNLLD